MKGLPNKIYRYWKFTDLINKHNICLVFHDIHCIRRVQESWVVIVHVLQENMDFGHIIFILLIKPSSIVCENKEHKLCGFLVIQDFCSFDSTIC